MKGGLPVREVIVANRAELLSVLCELAEECKNGLLPILHLDAHGHAEGGLLTAPSGEWTSWEDLVANLRAINAATGNNLVCIFALCFGLHLYRFMSITELVPAFLFIASSKEVTVGFLEDQTRNFYRNLIDTGDLTSAFTSSLAAEMTAIYCQALFLRALAGYVKEYCRGAGRKRRLERLLTEGLQEIGVSTPTPSQLQTLRKHARAQLKPGPHLIERFGATYLAGRPAGFTYREVESLANGSRR
ncbi:hypothetical protein [Caulobacter sp. NIBR2454]|uniref:hypothetical protein n=1 Tax=Caulobacter sp. NIBR2454 TaxID=3015996 RepID=UPI0022B5FEC0|nr:hypothetical protein [Caulobacter sp. NIBR2454]